MNPSVYKIAIIDESACIGCTQCLDVCPVDAIVGASQQMHTVISQECIGCELSLPPCPVDCISLTSLTSPIFSKEKIKSRHQQRQERLHSKEIIMNSIPSLNERKNEIEKIISSAKK